MKAKDILKFRGPERTSAGAITVAFDQHVGATENDKTNWHGRALKLMLEGWAAYRLAHRREFDSGIGENGVLGDHWERIGLELIGLLNGPTGGLDCGSIDGNVREMLRAEGFSGEE